MNEQISELEHAIANMRKKVVDLEISAAEKKEDVGKKEKNISKLRDELSKNR